MEIITGEKFKNWDSFRIHYTTNEQLDIDEVPYGTKVLVTHNSDHSVSDALYQNDNWRKLDERNDITDWFANNCDIADTRIHGLPLGIENPEWHPQIDKITKIKAAYLSSERKKSYSEREIGISAMFSTKTHPTRVEAMESVMRVVQKASFNYVAEDTTNGVDFDRYLDILTKSSIAICPRGNGLDTHRFWEACYAGAIPCCVEPMYLLIDGCTRSIMDNSLIDVSDEVLDMKYWRERIKNAL